MVINHLLTGMILQEEPPKSKIWRFPIFLGHHHGATEKVTGCIFHGNLRVTPSQCQHPPQETQLSLACVLTTMIPEKNPSMFTTSDLMEI